MSIKKLLKEGLTIHKNRFDNIGMILTESFNNTSFIKSEEFLIESTRLLISNKGDKFLSYLYESAELSDDAINICFLSFSDENSKLGPGVITFSLPAGWTCPAAKDCMKKVDRERHIDPEKEGTSKISKKTGEEVPYKGDIVVTKGKDSTYDCFAANQEMRLDDLRALRWKNFDLLKAAAKEGGIEAQIKLIKNSLEFFSDVNDLAIKEVRIHESGDFYNEDYLAAWVAVAKQMSDIKFYAYTKSLDKIKKYEDEINSLPNLVITQSEGGRNDAYIKDINIKTAKVFNTPEEVLKSGLIVDLDDTLAKEKGGREKDFALLVHGTQTKGEMSKNQVRNLSFINYWKNHNWLNRLLNKIFANSSKDSILHGIEIGTRLTNEQAKKAHGIISSTTIKGIPLNIKKNLMTQLNYVVRYNNYRFDEKLIAILPEKYRPNK